MMSSADQSRWFAHHPGLAPPTHHPDVAGIPSAAGSFGHGGQPAIPAYVEPGGYLDGMESYFNHIEGHPGYYGLNMQYRAHHRSISGK